MGKLSVINGSNLRQAIKLANEQGIVKEELIGIYPVPNSSEVNIVYWT